MEFLTTTLISFFAFFIGVPMLGGIARLFGVYTIVQEGKCKVYVLFGKVLGVIREPGIHLLIGKLGAGALIVNSFGRVYELDMRLDQTYLRIQPVNSEEGAPMGVGIWYEMFISDPTSYIFKNADPKGSLAANVSNATVRSLSNLPLGKLLEDRHTMSQTARAEVSDKSQEWGYKLGSVYIRKVHFRDANMTKQIEGKVVNRLRQVTAAIRQEGANQVNIITSTAEKEAAVEFAKAEVIRPLIVGKALQQISEDPEVAGAMFQILETENLLLNGAQVTMVPEGSGLMADLLATQGPNTGPKPQGQGTPQRPNQPPQQGQK